MYTIFTILLGWMINLEFGKGMGGIWLRPDSEGVIRVCFGNIKKMFIQPFINLDFWSFELIDINWFVFLLYFYTISYFIRTTYNNLTS